MADDRPQGYEYDHSFHIDDKIVPIHNLRYGNQRRCIFEIRSSFIIKTIDGPDHIIGSEKLRHGSDLGGQDDLYFGLRHRLTEYWMSLVEIRRLVDDAFAFAEKRPANMTLIPIVVDLKIRTVQQPNERLDSVMNRAVREENLIPVFLSLEAGEPDRVIGYGVEVILFLRVNLPRTRVRDVSEGSALMRVCPVCEVGPYIGAQISVLPGCNHAFHSGCISRWLLEDNLCPLCQLPVYQSFDLSNQRKEIEEMKSR